MSNKTIVSGLAAVALVLLASVIYWYTNRPLSVREVTGIYLDSSIDVENSDDDFSTTEPLQEAKAILDRIDHLTDPRGFYGVAQLCERSNNQFSCRLYTRDALGDGVQYAPHRQTIAVVLARWLYYLATQDEDQLSRMKKDLTNLHSLLAVDSKWLLQTNRFNCTLMADLIFDERLEEEYRQMAKDICLQADFEFYPESIVATNQNLHLPYKLSSTALTDEGDENEPWLEWETPVENDWEKAGDPNSEVYAWNGEALVNNISLMLTALAEHTPLNLEAVDDFAAERFITRELYAAMDNLARYHVSMNSGATDAQAAPYLLDWLMLTKETLEWYLGSTTAVKNYADNDTCLIQQNVSHFMQAFMPDFTAAQRAEVLDQLVNLGGDEIDKLSPGCMIARESFVDESTAPGVIMQAIADYNNTDFTQDWSEGIVTSHDGEHYLFPLETNALLAGLLSKE